MRLRDAIPERAEPPKNEPTRDMALPLLVPVRRLPAGGGAPEAAQGGADERMFHGVRLHGEQPFTLTLAHRDGGLLARCCDGRRQLGNRQPHAFVQPLPAAAALRAELKDQIWHPGWELLIHVDGSPVGQPLCKIELRELAKVPERGEASALVGVPGGVGGEVVAYLCRRRDELRAGISAQQEEEAELAARLKSREAALSVEVEEVQRTEADACLAFLPVLEAKSARLADLEREAVGMGCPVSPPSDEDEMEIDRVQ